MAPFKNDTTTHTLNEHCTENEEEPVLRNASAQSNDSSASFALGISNLPRDLLATGSRNHTPIRPVYEDFPTAHQSITSRSAKVRQIDGTKGSDELAEDSLLTPVLPLNLRQREQKSSNLAYEPLLPPIQALVANFTGPDLNFEFENFKFTSTPSRKLNLISQSVECSGNHTNQHTGVDSPMMRNLKKVWDSISTPGIKLTRHPSTKQTKWARDGLESRESPQNGGRAIQNKIVTQHGSFTPPASDRGLAGDGNSQDANKIDLLNHLRNSEYFAEPIFSPTGPKFVERNKVITSRTTRVPEGNSRLGAIDHHYALNAGIESNAYEKAGDSEEENLPVYSGCLPLVDSKGSLSTEGSTVENFVQRYAQSNELESDDERDVDLILPAQIPVISKSQHPLSQISLGTSAAPAANSRSNLPNLLKQSTAELLRQRRSGRLRETSSGKPPTASLPQLPAAIYQRTAGSTSEGLGQSSSYGDTRNLLEFTQRSQWMVASDGIRVANNNISPTGHRSQVASKVSRNPYLRFHDINAPTPDNFLDPSSAAFRGPPQKLYVSDKSFKAKAPQNDLERDISRALRRESSYSSASQESIIDQGGARIVYDSSKSESSDLVGLEESSNSNEKLVRELGFFNKNVIPPAWLGSQDFDSVRVPIGTRDVNSSSTHPTQSSSGASELHELSSLRGIEDDANDWETVGESGIVSRAATIPFGVLGGDIGNAGSSVANVSDNDDLSVYHAFSSAERFLEHPAEIGFSQDYRCRGMKGSGIPILLRTSENYTVNGFPVNSSRRYQLSQNALNHSTPAPLLKHKNPFTSIPPDLAGANTAKSGVLKSTPHGESRKTITVREEYGKSGIGNDESSTSYDWMDDFGDPGPAIRVAKANFAEDEYPDCNRQEVSFGNGNGISSIGVDVTRTAGSSLADSSTFSDYADSSYPTSNERQLCEPQSSTPPASTVNPRLTPRGRHLFVKGPPGAFYRDLRSGNGPCHSRLTIDRMPARSRMHRRRSSLEQPHPTNKMRSLSLLTVERPTTPVTPDGRHPNERQQSRNEFFYRSPLAEVKSRSWRNLYTRDQLVKHREAAEADGVHETASMSEQSSQPSCGQPLKAAGSWKRIQATPHMFAWPRVDSSIKTNTASRKAKISTIVLLICCLFPPVLLLYSIGRLDCLIMWWTNGEISSFKKGHKKWARRLGLFCVMCAILGAAIGFCLHFSRPEISA